MSEELRYFISVMTFIAVCVLRWASLKIRNHKLETTGIHAKAYEVKNHYLPGGSDETGRDGQDQALVKYEYTIVGKDYRKSYGIWYIFYSSGMCVDRPYSLEVFYDPKNPKRNYSYFYRYDKKLKTRYSGHKITARPYISFVLAISSAILIYVILNTL